MEQQQEQPSIRFTSSNGASENITITDTNGNNNTDMKETTISSQSTSSSSSSYVELYTFVLSILVFVVNGIFLIYCHYYFYINYNNNTKIQYTTSFLSYIYKNCITILLIKQQQQEEQINSTTSHVNDTATTTTLTTTLSDYYYFPNMDMIFITAFVIMTFEILDFITKNFGKWFSLNHIPVRGKHLDELRTIDLFCIAFSKANTGPFTYLYFQYCYMNRQENVIWDYKSILSIEKTIVPLFVLFILFDLFYGLFHCLLHIQWIYPYIHKHHHIQKAPSRANVDAVNVHPIEYVVGEYNHLFVLYIYTKLLNCHVHIVTALLFLVVGGILAGINHTRYDCTISIPIPNILQILSSPLRPNQNWIFYWTIYDSKAHDVHHRIPQSNYGQYFMFWDYLMGTYRPYNPKDRINPDAQLDPKTGKSLQLTNTSNSKAKTH